MTTEEWSAYRQAVELGVALLGHRLGEWKRECLYMHDPGWVRSTAAQCELCHCWIWEEEDGIRGSAMLTNICKRTPLGVFYA